MRFRFKIKWLMVLPLIIGLTIIIVFGPKLQERRCAAYLKRHGADIQTKKSGYYHHPVASVDCRTVRVSDRHLKCLRAFSQLERLRLSGKTVTDAGVAHIAELRSLTSLSLLDTGVSDSGLSELSQLSRLRVLRLTDSELGDVSIAEMVVHFKELVNVDLRKTKAGDETARSLASLPKLEWCNLDSTSITDAGLTHLSNHSNLGALMVPNTQVTDAGVMQLEQVKSLDALDVTNTNVTVSGVRLLVNKRPDIRVTGP